MTTPMSSSQYDKFSLYALRLVGKGWTVPQLARSTGLSEEYIREAVKRGEEIEANHG